MDIILLVDFFNRRLSAVEFSSLIGEEVNKYKEGYKTKGSTIPVYLSGNSEATVFTNDMVLTICDAFLNGTFSQWHVYYICDAILMSDSLLVKSEGLEEIVSSMTDPEINGELTDETVNEIKQQVS